MDQKFSQRGVGGPGLGFVTNLSNSGKDTPLLWAVAFRYNMKELSNLATGTP